MTVDGVSSLLTLGSLVPTIAMYNVRMYNVRTTAVLFVFCRDADYSRRSDHLTTLSIAPSSYRVSCNDSLLLFFGLVAPLPAGPVEPTTHAAFL